MDGWMERGKDREGDKEREGREQERDKAGVPTSDIIWDLDLFQHKIFTSYGVASKTFGQECEEV